ncbi:16S rRNA (uracil(1498)-N(3))-methyltransferase [Fusibacter paucivorans]|uniref:Ribosomal RNA small subunit methyltransferase E n=1 Tax=Fusibacter paucivorans TaxID=76009 RepID=A0ABS5PNN5_9FIRM|nr:RsmE family RNA methyltransferase [Fusibacter paucivorans]MBS7526775.1 16S rRNA (uracil(1498)-N(3))-methyltransferase [Fusibacter paucivorans]
MHRFFLSEHDQIEQNHIIIYHEATRHHMLNVLRMPVGEQCEVIANHMAYHSEIVSFHDAAIELNILSTIDRAYESPIDIDLYQCLPKGQKLELIIQKNVELGIHAIYLVDAKRCVVDFKHKDVEKKLLRYRKIAEEAAKQSKRLMVPDVDGILPLKALTDRLQSYDLIIVLYEDERHQTLKPLLKKNVFGNIAVIVGPEGGFDPNEIALLKDSGAEIITLGNRILRTETAGMAAIACIQYEIGDLS